MVPCACIRPVAGAFLIQRVNNDVNTYSISLQWRHNGCDGVSDHQPHYCLLHHLFGSKSKKTSNLRATGLCTGNSPLPVNSPHKWPVTRKMFHLMTSSYHGVVIVYKYHLLTVTPPPSLPHQPHPLHRLSSDTIIFVPLCKFRIIIFISCHPSSHIWPVW